MGWKSALSKVGLVELDEKEKTARAVATTAKAEPAVAAPAVSDDELEALLATDLSALTASPSASPSPAPVVTGITETSSLEEIYAEAGVSESPYPAEQLIAVLAGLGAVPAPQQKIMIEAMDAADKGWTISDPINDANAKCQALNGAKARLSQIVTSAESETTTKLEELTTFETQATAAIREDIRALEEKLAEEVKNITVEKATIAASLEQKRTACTQETAKLDTEIQRLQGLAKFITPPAPAPSPISTGE